MSGMEYIVTDKFFCILPFNHFATSVDGTSRLCCKIPSETTTGSLKKNSIKEIWQNKKMQSVRKQMQTGERVKECQVCYYEDSIGLISKRQNENEYYKKIDQTATRPTYLDLRLGNLCNLKCRMCNSTFSSQHVKEQNELAKLHPNLIQPYTEDNTAWYEDENFWSEIYALAPTLDQIIFAGGEPTLHPGVFTLLEKCVEIDRAKHIRVRLTTNMTNVPQRLINIIDEFKEFKFECSIDGIGKVFEYIRHPADWNTVKQNVESITHTKANIAITSVVQIYNLHNIESLWQWVDTFEGRVTFYPTLLYQPAHFQPGLIQQPYKQLILSGLSQYAQASTDERCKSRMQSIIKHVSIEPTTCKKDIVELRKFTKLIDDYRKEDIRTIIPAWDSWVYN